VRKSSARSIGGLLVCAVAAVAMAGCNFDGSSPSSSALSISGTPATQAAVGQAYSFKPVVTGSAASSAVGFSIQNKPMWATFSTSSGQLQGSPAIEDVGSYSNIIISASTGGAQASLVAFTINVTKSGSVTLNWQAPKTNTDGTPLKDVAGYTINYGTGATHLVHTVKVAATSYTFQNLEQGVWFFSVSAYTTAGVEGAPSAAVSTQVN
jgi:hypothetical protein